MGGWREEMMSVDGAFSEEIWRGGRHARESERGAGGGGGQLAAGG